MEELSPSQQAALAAIKEVFPELKARVFPKVPDAWIQQLWGPLMLNSMSLAALIGAMVWM